MNGNTSHHIIRSRRNEAWIARLFAGLALACCFLTSAAGQGVCLGPETTWTVQNPEGVNAGDVDGDGLPDLLLGGGFQASWARNLGQGSFDSPIPMSTPPIFQSHADMRAVDFDGDGDGDVIYAARGSVGICENLGGTDLDAGVALAANGAAYAQDLEPVDLDGDGDLDVAFAWTSSPNDMLYQVAWLENLGSLSFGPIQLLYNGTTSNGNGATHAADLDGDGDVDLFAMSPDGLLAIENLGAGVFAAAQVIEQTAGRDVTGTDVDGDGDEDIVAYHFGGIGLVWYENLGGQTFTGMLGAGQPIATVADVFKLAAADMDGDGDQDLVANGGDKVVMYANLGGGVFAAGIELSDTALNSRRLALSDIDGDGRTDLLYAAWSANKIALRRQQVPNSTSLSLDFSQPVPAGLDISIGCGFPNHYYFTAITADPANANGGLGTGWWGGLHIPFTEFAALVGFPAPPIQGTLDSDGTSSFSIPSGLSGLTGITLYANVTTFDLAQGGLLSARSDAVAHTLL